MDLSARVCAQHGRHRLDALLHRQRSRDVGVAEDQRHQAKILDSSSRVAASSGSASASRTGSR